MEINPHERDSTIIAPFGRTPALILSLYSHTRERDEKDSCCMLCAATEAVRIGVHARARGTHGGRSSSADRENC
jgi:hypothetical protein